MLDQMIESKGNGREVARRGRFLASTLGIFVALLMSAWTYSLFAKSYFVNGEIDTATLVSPVMVEENAPPPVPKQQNTDRTTSKKAVLEEIYDDVGRSGVPDDTLGKKNVISARTYGFENVEKGNRTFIPESVGRTDGNDAGSDNSLSGRDQRRETEDDLGEVKVKPKPSPTTTPAVPNRPISLGPVNGKAKYLPVPKYPAPAQAIRAAGQVNVEVTIDEQGNVISAVAVSGHPLLRASAVDSARVSKFTPTTLGGRPVKVTGIIIYNFVPR